jgi:hypothetical protein
MWISAQLLPIVCRKGGEIVNLSIFPENLKNFGLNLKVSMFHAMRDSEI